LPARRAKNRAGAKQMMSDIATITQSRGVRDMARHCTPEPLLCTWRGEPGRCYQGG
jgi:hypothetical protein